MRTLLIVLMTLFTSPAPAYTPGTRAWIAEFGTGRVEAQAPMAKLPALVHQPALDLSKGNAKSNAFNTDTRYIRVICEVPCQIIIGGGAPSSAIILPSMQPEYFGVEPGAYLSATAL